MIFFPTSKPIPSNFVSHLELEPFFSSLNRYLVRFLTDMLAWKNSMPPNQNVSPSHPPKKILRISISGMTCRTWLLSVAKSWWITWRLPTSANVPRRLDACVTVAVPRWKATSRPVRGKQVMYHQHLVMSLNRSGVGWRSVLNKILFWCEHFWKGTFMSEKSRGERRKCQKYPKRSPLYSYLPLR